MGALPQLLLLAVMGTTARPGQASSIHASSKACKAGDSTCSSGDQTPFQGEAMLQMKQTGGQAQKEPEVPSQCAAFFLGICGLEVMPETTYAMNGEFVSCCRDGGHEESTCSSIGLEAFAQHIGPPTDDLCAELVALYKAHTSWVTDHLQKRASLAQDRGDSSLDSVAHWKNNPDPEPTPAPTPDLTPEPTRKPTPMPTPSQPMPDPAPDTRTVSQLEWEHFNLVNTLRATGFTCPDGTFFAVNFVLQFDCNLWRASQLHSQDMADNNYFSHTSQDGRSPWDRARAQGGSANGENIAAGASTAQAVLGQWRRSNGHCRNMGNAAFTRFAVGHAAGGSYGHYWTQMFGGVASSDIDTSCYPDTPTVSARDRFESGADGGRGRDGEGAGGGRWGGGRVIMPDNIPQVMGHRAGSEQDIVIGEEWANLSDVHTSFLSDEVS